MKTVGAAAAIPGPRRFGETARPDAWWVPTAAALFILWAPGGFRLICYYYRGA